MKNKVPERIFLSLLFIFTFSLQVNCATAPQAVGNFNQFLTVGAVKVNTDTSYSNASTVWNPISFNITYPSTFVQVTKAEIGLSLQ